MVQKPRGMNEPVSDAWKPDARDSYEVEDLKHKVRRWQVATALAMLAVVAELLTLVVVIQVMN